MQHAAPHAIRVRSILDLLGIALVVFALSPLQAGATVTLNPDGKTVYDSANGINWLADSNLAASNRFGLPLCTGSIDTKTCVNASGSMSYQAAAAWVNAMNAANYLGHGNWQLPTTPLSDNSCSFIGPQANSFGWNCAGSALGSLYYNALGFNSPNTAVSIPGSTVGPFNNFQPYLYWSQSNDVQNGSGYYTFSFNSGFNGSNTAPNFLYALPMVPGKIPGTPTATGTGLQVNSGGQTVYDPVTNVTWLANANLAATNTFGLSACTAPGKPKLCVNQDGAMNWDSATQFVANMNASGYLGQTNWELPRIDANCSGYNCSETGSPMGELFYGQLGLRQGASVVAAPNIAIGPYHNVQPYLYWSCAGATVQGACQTAGPAPNFEWSFSFGNGFAGTDLLQNDLYVTAYFAGSGGAFTPATGYWWNPAEGGRGFTIEQNASSGNVFFATYLYTTGGNPVWYAAGPAPITGATFSAPLAAYSNGQSLTGAFQQATLGTSPGNVSIVFIDASHATLTWPGGTIPIQRYEFMPGGLNSPPTAAQPQSGYWWNPAEGGRGYTVEVQNNTAFVAGYMYDSFGNPVWYASGPATLSGNTYQGTLTSYSGGQTLAGAYKPATGTASVGSVTIQFSSAIVGTLTLPNGRQIPIQRFGF